MLYRPSLSVRTVRTFSMRTGLLASTVTPGRTAPLESRAMPLMALCARAAAGAITKRQTVKTRKTRTLRLTTPYMGSLLLRDRSVKAAEYDDGQTRRDRKSVV